MADVLLPTFVPVIYPETDGKPMADNTRQLRWIVTVYGNLAALDHHRADILVGADLNWIALRANPLQPPVGLHKADTRVFL